jgi:hypothetical protein
MITRYASSNNRLNASPKNIGDTGMSISRDHWLRSIFTRAVISAGTVALG